jgi:dTDP-4-dehydrorhamnose reductase
MTMHDGGAVARRAESGDEVMRILVIGRNGQVATALARLGAESPHDIVCLGRDDLDVFSRTAIEGAVFRVGAEAIINTAAYTEVDKAESDQDAAYALNMRVPLLLAEISAAMRLPLIHLSTDYVFDGTKATPYEPGDPIRPISVYGASKAAGETAVRTTNPLAVIFRTAWVYSDTGSNFVKRMLELGAEHDELRIVDDQIGNPTPAGEVAAACLNLACHEGWLAGSAGGIYHFAGQGDVTWYGFAGAIFDEARLRGRRVPTRLIPIRTDQYPTPARRPANSRLDCSATKATFGIASQPWQNGLRTCLKRILA